MQITIRKIRSDEWDDMISLVWRTFLKFEAPQFEEEGIRSFMEFISDERLKKLFEIGEYPIFAAYADQRMAGTISLRNDCHVSLLFVAEAFQKKGIGRLLVNRAEEYVRNDTQKNCLTVNAAPYATEFYHRVGFEDTQPQQHQDGIIFTPMIKLLTQRL